MSDPEKKAPQDELSEEELGETSGGLTPAPGTTGSTSEFPDVTKTPSGGLPLGPTPYPNQDDGDSSTKPKKVDTGG